MRVEGPVLSERLIMRVERPFVHTPAVDFRAIPRLNGFSALYVSADAEEGIAAFENPE